jgi:peptidoglycan/LPS O-acetylase OafA/YrhL
MPLANWKRNIRIFGVRFQFDGSQFNGPAFTPADKMGGLGGVGSVANGPWPIGGQRPKSPQRKRAVEFRPYGDFDYRARANCAMSPPRVTSAPVDKSASRRPTIPHLPALDGLRGLAVLGVLFFHDGRLPGGYLGVDLFFVLSGYLITSLLLAEWSSAQKIDLATFWIRRARRLFPALLALMPAVALYAAKLAQPGELLRIRYDGFATLAYIANWRAIFAGRSYWDIFEAPSPLEHTWSLAIEEQFYVIWPLFTVAVLYFSRGSRRVLLGFSLILGILSTASLSWYGTRIGGADRAYLGTDTRGAAILFGAALACFLAERKTSSSSPEQGPSQATPKWSNWDVLGVLAMLGLGWAWLRMDGQHAFLYRGGFLATEIAVLVLIVCATHGTQSIIGKALAFRPLTWVGLTSYGVYLWHWPLFVILSPERLPISGWLLTLLRFSATLAVSLISYRWLEQPIRKHGLRFGKPIVVLPAVVAMCSWLLWNSTHYIATAKSVLMTLPLTSVIPPGTKSVLVVGDSVAQALGERMRSVQTGKNIMVIERGTPNCSILEGTVPTLSLSRRRHEGGDCDIAWEKDAETLHPDIALVVLGGGHFAPAEVDGRWQRPCENGWTRVYAEELEKDLRALKPRVGQLWVTRIPYGLGVWQRPERDKHIDCFNRMIADVTSHVGDIRILDLGKHLCPSGRSSCATKSDGFPIRPDGLHFAGDGAKETANWVLDQLR